MNGALLYSARQLARGLGVTSQAIRKRMAIIRPDASVIAGGNLTAAWHVESLPAGLRIELEQGARKAGYHLVDHFLRSEPAPQPRDPKPPVVITRPSDERFRDLLIVFQVVRNPSAPGLADRAFVWGQVVEFYLAAAQPGSNRKLKRDLLRFVNRHAPWLARNSNALRVAFERRLKDPAALTDLRPEENAKRRVEISQADIDTLVMQGVFECGGYTPQAFRECRQEGILSPDLANRHIANPSRKSYVPAPVRQAVSQEIRILHKLHKHPRQWELEGDYIERDWSKVFAGDFYQGDDQTPDVYFWIPDDQGWFTVMRGQFLPFIDCRSKRILQAPLLASENYNAFAIRNGMDGTCRVHGLPRKGWYFERGIWKRSCMVKGLPTSAVAWTETVGAFARLGLKFWHAQTARAKPIENVLGLLDRKMFGEPGYCGRDEKRDKHERVQKAIQDVKARRVTPADAGFYSYDQWCARLAQICDEYNAEPQDSRMIGRLSPNAAWEAFQNPDDPLIEFDARCQLVFANEHFPIKVGRGGRISLPIKSGWVYKSPETRPLEGQRLLAWIGAADPEVITLTDLRWENPISVPRVAPSDAANPEEIGSALSLIRQGNRICRERYLELKSAYNAKRRANIVAPVIEELNRAMVEQHQALRQQESARKSKERRLQQAAREVRLNRGALNPNTDQALEALRNLPRQLAALDLEGEA